MICVYEVQFTSMDDFSNNPIAKKAVAIALDMEGLRNTYFSQSDSTLFYKTLSLYLGNFCVRYPLLLHELIETKLPEDLGTDVIYKALIRSQGDSRYLMEIFLTTCHLLAQPKLNREQSCLSLHISELIHIDRQDRIILNTEATDITKSKITSNQAIYENLKALSETIGVGDLPKYLNECTPALLQTSGLKYYPFGKIKYDAEFDNPIVCQALKADKAGLENLVRPLYAIFSFNEHPTYYSLEKINSFIPASRPTKIDVIVKKKYETLSMVRPIAQAMAYAIRRYLLDDNAS